MPERPDLRAIARDIRESLADYDRETLVDILTYVFKEYVVDGVPPALLGRADTVEDLAGLSFPELMRVLQTRLEHPELELFQVQDDVVLVRAQGVLTPLTEDQVPRRARPAPVAMQDTTSEAPVRATATEAAARGRGDLLGGQRGAVTAPPPRPAPPPARGMSISGRAAPTPAGGGSSPAPDAPRPAPPAAASSATPPAAAAAKDAEAKEEKKHPEGDDPSSIRFSLLELD